MSKNGGVEKFGERGRTVVITQAKPGGTAEPGQRGQTGGAAQGG